MQIARSCSMDQRRKSSTHILRRRLTFSVLADFEVEVGLQSSLILNDGNSAREPSTYTIASRQQQQKSEWREV